MQASKTIVIVGGGFAGLNAAKILGREKSLRVIVLDRRNHHLFQPLLYQIATAGLSPADITQPIRTILRRYRNVEVYLDKVDRVDVETRQVITEKHRYSYDYLILACGASHSYFGHDDWEDFAPGLKTVEQATEIRRRILMAYELAEQAKSPEERSALLNFVIIGGGPTGVELAGAIGEISHQTLDADFRKINPAESCIYLVEAGPRILAGFSPESSERAERDLKKFGVTVLTNSRVSGVSAQGVSIGEKFIPARTVIWAAGVKPSSVGASLGVPMDQTGRVIVGPDLTIPGYREVFVLGDQAHFAHTASGQPLPGVAPVAIQQGRYAARTILRELRGGERKPFHYIDKGMLATIGRADAVAEVAGVRLGGWIAWMAWLVVHIFYLIGFKNRVLVLIQWMWSYITYRRGARLIVDKDWKNY